MGAATCREVLPDGPAELAVHSLRQAEAEEAVRELALRFPGSAAALTPLHGNVFLPHDLKDRSREELLRDPASRRRLLDDIYAELSPQALRESALYRILSDRRPQVVVDCINTATALAYQDVYYAVRRVREQLDAHAGDAVEGLAQAVEEQLAILQLPLLIRHIQVLFEAMRRTGVEVYLKIGTTGTGGMGLNIPYTHSEEKPSRLLLAKAGLAGAHSMLLFLMGSTPDGPVVKEIKPAAAVAWKRIGRGPVLRGGRPIPLYDTPLEAALPPAVAIRAVTGAWHPLDEDAVLEAAFIDTGENGMFSLEEFETVTALGQMEFVTPEEIARHALREIKGGTTGKEVVAALAGACLGPSYRAGVLREGALAELAALDAAESPSIAFEMLGPPRLSKLLYEAHLLHRVCRPLTTLAEADPAELAARLVELLGAEPALRARILSIGIPILLPDGRLLRGPEVKTPPHAAEVTGAVGEADVDRWARAGWVDLRPRNLARWQERLRAIRAEVAAGLGPAAGSAVHPTPDYWEGERPYSPGKLAAWIFAREDGGARA